MCEVYSIYLLPKHLLQEAFIGTLGFAHWAATRRLSLVVPVAIGRCERRLDAMTVGHVGCSLREVLQDILSRREGRGMED